MNLPVGSSKFRFLPPISRKGYGSTFATGWGQNRASKALIMVSPAAQKYQYYQADITDYSGITGK